MLRHGNWSRLFNKRKNANKCNDASFDLTNYIMRVMGNKEVFIPH